MYSIYKIIDQRTVMCTTYGERRLEPVGAIVGEAGLRPRFAYKWPDNVKMYKSAKFDKKMYHVV